MNIKILTAPVLTDENGQEYYLHPLTGEKMSMPKEDCYQAVPIDGTAARQAFLSPQDESQSAKSTSEDATS